MTEDLASDMKQSKAIVNAYLKDQDIGIEKVSMIDFEDVSHDTYVVLVLVKTSTDGVGAPVRVNALASRLVRGRILMVGATSYCETEDDISWVKQTARRSEISIASGRRGISVKDG
ncbi:MAG: hypothetical protein WD872_04020, partial [Pirellulaceae bacterium]